MSTTFLGLGAHTVDCFKFSTVAWVHLNIAPLQRRWAHRQVWHTGVHLLPRGGRCLFPPDPTRRGQVTGFLLTWA